MNSSNSNNVSAGFLNLNDPNSQFGFNSPALGSGKPTFGSVSAGLSKPRLMKMRKPTATHHPRSTPDFDRVDLGFNPFQPISVNSEMGSSVLGNMNSGNVGNEPFVFAANRSNSNSNLNSGKSSGVVGSEILDDLKKLKIASEKELKVNRKVSNLNASGKESLFQEESNKGVFVFESGSKKSGIDESVVSELPDEMSKLNIGGSGNVGSLKNAQGMSYNLSANNNIHLDPASGVNVSNAFGSSVVKELPNEMKKLNIKDPVEVDGGSMFCNADATKKFAFGSNSKDGGSLAGSSETILPDKLKNLNLKDSLNAYGGGENKEVNVGSTDKNTFVFGSSKLTNDGLGGRAENIILHEVGTLKIGSRAGAGDTNAQTHTGFDSSTKIGNEMLHQNLGDKKLHDVSNSIPEEFSSQAGAQSRCSSGIQIPIDHQHAASLSSSFSSSGIHFQPVGNVFGVPSMNRPENEGNFSFTRKWDDMGTPHEEFKMPNPKGNLLSGLNRSLETQGESTKATRSKKKKGKLKKHIPVQLRSGQNFVLREGSQEDTDSLDTYSPMDVSPYQETLANNSSPRETSVTSDESFHYDNNYASSDLCPTVSNDATDEVLLAATERLDINEGDIRCRETKEEVSEYCLDKGVGVEGPSEESVSGAETESFKSANEQLDYSTDTFVTAVDNEVDTEVSFNSNIQRQASDGRVQLSFASNSEDIGKTRFTFAASSSAQHQSAAAIHKSRKKNRLKVGHDSYSSTPNAKVPYAASSVQFFPPSGTSSLLSPKQGKKGDVPPLSSKSDKSEPTKHPEVKQETVSSYAASIAAQEACEKWRLRGNQAYANGDLSKAENCYTQGVNCVSQSETSRSCLRALMLCYSNRAATRMSLGRMRVALEDCMMAATIDPNFLRVQVRAANCYLALGEVESASLYFMKCLQSGSDVCVDRKLLVEGSDGLEKSQRVSEKMKQSAGLLQRRTSSDAECALSVIAEALMISSYSEKLLEMKADALLMLRKYEEVIRLCEQTLASAEMNSPTLRVDSHPANLDASDIQRSSSVELWRLPLIFKSYFYLGRLEEALDFLKKEEESLPLMERNGSKTLEPVIPLAATVRELLRHKAAGNEAFQVGRHAEAVEHYTAAISCSVESRPFAAICFCNRAAAYRTMGQVTDAIADCSLAIALDGNYLKAISRRATLFEMIRDYGQAAIDLQRLVSLLTKQVEEKTNQSGSSDKMSCLNEFRQTQFKLSVMEEEARKEIPLNMYLILGVEPSAAISEMKKAYRKAALKHHPDKASQSLARSENGDDGLWKEIAEEVHKDADRLFKMIGEAYAILSDPTKRIRYDQEEEMRNASNKGHASSTTRMPTDAQNYPFERSGNRRQWQDARKSYGNPQSRGSERTRSNRTREDGR